MIPSARIEMTINLLQRVQDSRIPMDSVCGDFFRQRRFIGSKDRADIAERIYEVVRHHARLGWILGQSELEDTPRNRMIVFLSLEGNPQRIKDLFDGTKYGPAPLDEKEEKFVENFQIPEYPQAVAVECPPDYEDKLRGLFGEDFIPEMQAMLTTAPLDLRVNTLKCKIDKAQNFLEADGVASDKTELSLWGLRCKNKAYLSRTKAFNKGWIEIQDEGSQMIARACDAGPGQQVLDYCAGAGGKTLALAQMMEGKGRIVAMDTDARRLDKARPRLKKAGASDIVEIRPLDETNRKWLKRQKGKFDVVLVDVPCSGSGTWRRNPDMRWRTYGPSLEELQEIQEDILSRVAGLVKPGGRLVYATCSLFREENEAQIEKFLQNHQEFNQVPVGEPFEGKVMRLTPHRHNTDGFFAGVMEKSLSS